MPHERDFPAEPGRPAETIRVRPEDLQTIADKANERIARTGRLDTLTIGHRNFDPNFPETQQPPLIGFCRDYRVEMVQRQGGPVLALTYQECVAKDMLKRYEVDRQYPFRSAEYHPSRGIAGVAALVRPPALDMGTVYRYQGYAMDEMTPDEMAGYAQFSASMKRYGDRCAKYMKRYADEQMTDDETLEYKAFGDEVKQYSADTVKKYMKRYSAESNPLPTPAPAPAPDANAFAAYHATLDNRIRQIESQYAVERKARLEAEANRELDRLEPIVRFDRARELTRLLTYQSDAERAEHLKYMLDTYSPLPGAAGPIRVYQDPARPSVPAPFAAPANHDAAMSYMRAHPGMSYDEAAVAVAKR